MWRYIHNITNNHRIWGLGMVSTLNNSTQEIKLTVDMLKEAMDRINIIQAYKDTDINTITNIATSLIIERDKLKNEIEGLTREKIVLWDTMLKDGQRVIKLKSENTELFKLLEQTRIYLADHGDRSEAESALYQDIATKLDQVRNEAKNERI